MQGAIFACKVLPSAPESAQGKPGLPRNSQLAKIKHLKNSRLKIVKLLLRGTPGLPQFRWCATQFSHICNALLILHIQIAI